MTTNNDKLAALQARRDEKAISHLDQYAPVWLRNESLPQDENLLFDAVFYHPAYGWVSRRYLFDGFNQVLYHKGQIVVSESEALELAENQEPYISAEDVNTVNSYGG